MFRSKQFKIVAYSSAFILLIFFLSFLYFQNETQALTKPNQGELTGSESHAISLEEATKLTKNYRDSAPTGSVYAEYFGGTAVKEVLNQDGCIGLRVYYGKKDDGTMVLVLVGTDKSGNDMIDNAILEYGYLCPPICSIENALNK